MEIKQEQTSYVVVIYILVFVFSLASIYIGVLQISSYSVALNEIIYIFWLNYIFVIFLVFTENF